MKKNYIKNLVKSLEKNEEADTILDLYIKGNPDKHEGAKCLVDLARVNNADLFLRAKALALLAYFKEMCCGRRIGAYYIGGEIICTLKGIPEIIEDNCHDLIRMTENLSSEEILTGSIFDLLYTTTNSILSYRISRKIKKRFKNYFLSKLSLNKKTIDSEAKSYIYGQLKKL
jgi:hypothetical protein